MNVIPIQVKETQEWITQRHYAKRMPSISYAYGLYNGSDMVGVCT